MERITEDVKGNNCLPGFTALDEEGRRFLKGLLVLGTSFRSSILQPEVETAYNS